MPDPTSTPTPDRPSLSRHPRRRFGALLLAGLAVAGLTGATSPVEASAATRTARFESSTITYTNAARISHHEAKVRASRCLHELAKTQARKMAAAQRLYHQDLYPVLTKCKLTSAAENIAYGYPSSKATVTAWMHSAGHRANILHSGYRVIGVGAVRDEHGRWWVSEVFGRA